MKALMYFVITVGVFIVAVLFVLAVSIPKAEASGGHHECHHHHDCDKPDPEPMPDPGPVVVHKKKVVVNVPALLLGVAGGVCIYKRFWLNDPCIGKPARKTSAADDKVAPAIPTGRLYQ